MNGRDGGARGGGNYRRRDDRLRREAADELTGLGQDLGLI